MKKKEEWLKKCAYLILKLIHFYKFTIEAVAMSEMLCSGKKNYFFLQLADGWSSPKAFAHNTINCVDEC